MKKIILTTLVIGAAIATTLVPTKAEALQLKIRPSLTFKNKDYCERSHRVVYPVRRVVTPVLPPPPPRRVVREYTDVYRVREPYVPYTRYDTYTEMDYYYDYPSEYVEEYYPPHRSRCRTRGTDLKLKFKLK